LHPLVLGKESRRLRMAVPAWWGRAVVRFAVLQPRMRRAVAGLDLVRREPADPRLERHRQLLRTYIALDARKLAVGMWAIGRDEAPRHPVP
jgi:hypothetical protein